MGILGRCRDILASNINALLDKAEDPEKMVDQMMCQAKEDLAEVKRETASVMANEKNAKRRLDECQEKIDKYTSAARNAVSQGSDEDARKLLQSKQRLEATLQSLQENYDQAHSDAESMRATYSKLLGDIELLEIKSGAIKGKAATAKAREHASKVAVGRNVGSSVEAFERIETKVNKRLDTAIAMETLDKQETLGDNLLQQYSGGASSKSVEDELAALKSEINPA